MALDLLRPRRSGAPMPASSAMMAMTTSNSIKVKARIECGMRSAECGVGNRAGGTPCLASERCFSCLFRREFMNGLNHVYQLRTLSLLGPVLALFPGAELAFPSGPRDQTMTVVLASKLS